jgi:hypothetical protein
VLSCQFADQRQRGEEIVTMRQSIRRLFLGLGIIVTTTSAFSVLAAAPASAGTCYTVYVGSDGVTICPWQ